MWVVVRRFRSSLDDDIPSDIIVGQAVSSAPVLEFTVANSCEVWEVGAEAHFSDDVCIVRNGFDVIGHGADGSS